MKFISIYIRFTLLLLFVGMLLPAFNAAAKPKPKLADKPKLVVGIVVDQMRYDFLYRYWNKYGEGGFKRLVKEGFQYTNTHYNYVPTYTGPGHASIYTGTTPSVHGIIANDWYNRELDRLIYCTEDKKAQTVGSNTLSGQMSPANLWVTTITDELKLATNQKAKVIGVCLKDRGSILPAGHAADAAYWYDGSLGGWISSTFYMQQLPQWVQDFNNKKTAAAYLQQTWKTLLPIDQYTESTADDTPFEVPFAAGTKPVFPYNLSQLKGDSYNLLRSTPFGNSYTKDFAIATLEAEKMGKGQVTDFLAVSFSSTDYIGHQFGPNSIEVEDTYLRLDKDLAELLSYLDKYVGKDNVLVFLSSDHGVAHVPAYLQSLRIPAGSANGSMMLDSVNRYLESEYGKGRWIVSYSNQQVFLNHPLITAKKHNLKEMQEKVAQFLIRFDGVARTVTASALAGSYWQSGIISLVQQGHHQKRSGDVIVVSQPGWFEGYGSSPAKGSTHGSAANYDTHVPLLFYGWKVKAGESTRKAYITDIAPTLANWLKIQEPNGTTGQALPEGLNP